MDTREFFAVLHESNLDGSFGWYYQSPMIWLVLLFSIVCAAVVCRYAWRRKSEVAPEATLRELIHHPQMVLPIDHVVAAGGGVLGILLTAYIWVEPIHLLTSIDSGIDSLYDLTPAGVQLVVEVLQYSALFALVTCFCLGATAIAVIWLEFLDPKTSSLPGTYDGDKLKLPVETRRWVLLFAATLAIVVYLVSSFLTHSSAFSGAEFGNAFQSFPQCSTNPKPLLVWQEWRETIESPRQLSGKLALRFEDRRRISQPLKFQVGDNTFEFSQLDPTPEHDPIDIVVVPLLDGKVSQEQIMYAALSLDIFLAHFNLKGLPLGDRVHVLTSRGKDYVLSDASFWARGAVNEMFLSAQTPKDRPIDVDKALKWLLKAWPKHPVSNSQLKPTQVIILLRWLSESDPIEQETTSQIETNVPMLQEQDLSVWGLDFVAGVHPDYRDAMTKLGVEYFELPIPAQLFNEDLSFNLSAVPNVVSNQNLPERIAALRSTSLAQFNLKHLLASRGSVVVRVLEGVQPACYWEVDLTSLSGSGARAQAGAMPLLTLVKLAALITLTIMYPIGLIIAIPIQLLGQNGRQ